MHILSCISHNLFNHRIEKKIHNVHSNASCFNVNSNYLICIHKLQKWPSKMAAEFEFKYKYDNVALQTNTK